MGRTCAVAARGLAKDGADGADGADGDNGMVRLPTDAPGGGGATGRAMPGGGGAAGRSGAVAGAGMEGAGTDPSPPSPGLARSVIRTVSFFRGTGCVWPSDGGGGTGDGGWVSSDMIIRGKVSKSKDLPLNQINAGHVNEFFGKNRRLPEASPQPSLLVKNFTSAPDRDTAHALDRRSSTTLTHFSS